ncbi:MAG: epoxide hydrolase, soluble (sEH) [Chrysothrix sp. TS-e1954]|nr:MAG: epoxide hydrolase, soluble (sEH) [Chrysothrix sp. TS-e1954]
MDSPFQPFPHSSSDLILAVHYNFYGTRLATASSDHTVKVWDKQPSKSAPASAAAVEGQAWELCDSWRAHGAEVLDISWAPPYSGTYLATISTSCTLKIWSEDLTTPPRSGHRFRLCTLSSPYPSPSLHPFSSLCFTSSSSPASSFLTYLALTTLDGILLVLEPRDHDNLAGEWLPSLGTGGSASDGSRDFMLTRSRPARGEETNFQVVWHAERCPAWTAVQAGLERRALSLAVAAMDSVKIYRTDRDRQLYLAATIENAGGREGELIRGVAWSNGSMRGWDTIAAGGKDGVVRVWELRTPRELLAHVAERSGLRGESEAARDTESGTVRRKPQATSAISTDLARLSSKTSRKSTSADEEVAFAPPVQQQQETEDPMATGRVPSEAKLVAELKGHKGAVWRVGFSFTGELLTSTGDDGLVKTWKRGFDGAWCEWADVDVTHLQ